MDLERYKRRKEESHLTFRQLSNMSGIPIQTLHNFFRGKTANPRIDTVRAIEKALGIENGASKGISEKGEDKPLTDKEARLLSAYNELIPSMQEFVIELLEGLVQNGEVTTQRKA